MEKKICIKCFIEKDVNLFYKGNNQCKSCKISYQKKLEEKKILEKLTLDVKTCNNCKIEKEIIQFNKYGNRCKDCEILYYNENKEKISIKKKKYNKENKEKIKQNWISYYENNKDIVLEKGKERYDSEYKKNYYIKNKDTIKIKRNERYRIRIKEDIIYKLKISLRSMVKNSFLRKGFKKDNKTEYIIGCSLDFLRNHLESKFEPWMTWDNKGLYNGELNYGWDIDHIIPLSTAETEDDIIKLNHYTNLQPLCSKINRNIKKGR
jgi:hypothetical protein